MMSTLIASTMRIILSITCVGKVNYDVITRSHLQLINTLIDTFFSKLCAFSTDQRKEVKPMMVKRKLNGTVDKSSADQKIRKST